MEKLSVLLAIGEGNPPHKEGLQWGAWMFSLLLSCIRYWTSNGIPVIWDVLTVMYLHSNNDNNFLCHYLNLMEFYTHDDVIKWKHFPRYCPFVRGIHRSPMNSPHKGQWRGALMFSGCPVVREKSGKFQTWQQSGKSQGIMLKVREKMNIGKSQGICI